MDSAEFAESFELAVGLAVTEIIIVKPFALLLLASEQFPSYWARIQEAGVCFPFSSHLQLSSCQIPRIQRDGECRTAA